MPVIKTWKRTPNEESFITTGPAVGHLTDDGSPENLLYLQIGRSTTNFLKDAVHFNVDQAIELRNELDKFIKANPPKPKHKFQIGDIVKNLDNENVKITGLTECCGVLAYQTININGELDDYWHEVSLTLVWREPDKQKN